MKYTVGPILGCNQVGKLANVSVLSLTNCSFRAIVRLLHLERLARICTGGCEVTDLGSQEVIRLILHLDNYTYTIPEGPLSSLGWWRGRKME